MQGYTRKTFVKSKELNYPRKLPANMDKFEQRNVSGVQVVATTTTNLKGPYCEVFASTPEDAYGIWLAGCDVNLGGGQNNTMLVDIAIGPDGEEQVIIPDINFSGAPVSSSFIQAQKYIYFPGIYIPAGIRVAARCQSNTASRNLLLRATLDFGLKLDRESQNGVVAYGAVASVSSGVTVAYSVNAFNSWFEIGTTTRDHTIWNVGLDAGLDTSLGNESIVVDIGWGPTSAGVTSIGLTLFRTSSTENVQWGWPPVMFSPVASGTKVWARISGNAGAQGPWGVTIYGN